MLSVSASFVLATLQITTFLSKGTGTEMDSSERTTTEINGDEDHICVGECSGGCQSGATRARLINDTAEGGSAARSTDAEQSLKLKHLIEGRRHTRRIGKGQRPEKSTKEERQETEN